MQGERVPFRVEQLENGRLRASCPANEIVVEADDIEDLRHKVDLAVEGRFGETRPISLVIVRTTQENVHGAG